MSLYSVATAVAWLALLLAGTLPCHAGGTGKPTDAVALLERLMHEGAAAGGAGQVGGQVPGRVLSASRDLGVTHCLLQGMLRNRTLPRQQAGCRAFDGYGRPWGTNINVHIFLKLVVLDGVAYVRGFAAMERVGVFMGWHFVQAPDDHHLWSHELWLVSVRSGHRYGPVVAANDTNVDLMKYFRVPPLVLRPEDAEHPEFEVFSDDLAYTCPLLPAKRPVLARTFRTDAGSMPHPPPRASAARDPAAGTLQPVTADDEAPRRRAVFMLAPFFSTPVHVVAKLLLWSIRWHDRFGFDTYVVYVQWGLQELLQDDIAKDLVSSGRLVLVHWDAMAGLATPTLVNDTRDICKMNAGYWHKLIIYNHFFVSMWLEDVLVFEADYDEWIMTPKPMAVSQIVDECMPPSQRTEPLASVDIPRRVGLCANNCSGLTEREMWMRADVYGPPEQHPLLQYQLQWADTKPKSLYFPEFVLSVGAHFSQPMAGTSRAALPDRSCAFVLHMAQMMVERRYQHDDGFYGDAAADIPQELLWPLHASNMQGQSMRELGHGTG